MPEPKSKISWGEEVNEELGGTLPSTTVSGPDENGIKTITSIFIDDDGKKVKLVRKLKVKKVATTLNKAAAARKQWKKFGDEKGHPPGPDPATTNVGDVVLLKLSLKQSTIDEEETTNPLDALKKKDKVVVCRLCKGDHWSTRCPYKDKLGGLTDVTPLEPETEKGAESPMPEKGAPGKYVPPALRGDAGKRKPGELPGRNTRDDSATIRMTNLSEDTRESDLADLVRHFGPTTRIFLAKDKLTGASKGFAFISFVHKESAVKAIEALNGYGYDNLILHVEWSRPSSD